MGKSRKPVVCAWPKGCQKLAMKGSNFCHDHFEAMLTASESSILHTLTDLSHSQPLSEKELERLLSKIKERDTTK